MQTPPAKSSTSEQALPSCPVHALTQTWQCALCRAGWIFRRKTRPWVCSSLSAFSPDQLFLLVKSDCELSLCTSCWRVSPTVFLSPACLRPRAATTGNPEHLLPVPSRRPVGTGSGEGISAPSQTQGDNKIQTVGLCLPALFSCLPGCLSTPFSNKALCCGAGMCWEMLRQLLERGIVMPENRLSVPVS